MFTDRDVATALTQATQLERQAREHLEASRSDLPEQDAALIVVRHTVALKRGLEQWIAARACRAALKTA